MGAAEIGESPEMLGQVAWHLLQHTTGSEDWHPELPHAHTRIHTLPYTHIKTQKLTLYIQVFTEEMQTHRKA